MPIYSYQCIDCGVEQEYLEPVKADTLYIDDTHMCPACSSTMKFIYSPAHFRLKGSGFYKKSED